MKRDGRWDWQGSPDFWRSADRGLIVYRVKLSGQSRNRTGTDIVGARDLAHGLALIAPADGFLLLVRGQLRLAAETFPGRLGARPALAGAGAISSR
jgi:hypothetical protein